MGIFTITLKIVCDKKSLPVRTAKTTQGVESDLAVDKPFDKNVELIDRPVKLGPANVQDIILESVFRQDTNKKEKLWEDAQFPRSPKGSPNAFSDQSIVI